MLPFLSMVVLVSMGTAQELFTGTAFMLCSPTWYICVVNTCEFVSWSTLSKNQFAIILLLSKEYENSESLILLLRIDAVNF